MKIAKGDTVYLGDGTKCEYGNQVIGGGHLVYIISRLHESAESDLFTVPQIVQEIYPQPPIAVKVEKVKELDQQISDRVTRLIKIQEELREADFKRNELAKQIARNEALQHVVDFLEGRIKYCVIDRGSEYNISSLEEILKEMPSNYSRQSGYKLLSLFGNLKKELAWGVSEYSDGSGSYYKVWPFYTLEAARDFLVQYVEAAVDQELKQLHVHRLVIYERMYNKLNSKYGFDLKLPAAALAAIQAQKKLSLEERKAKLLQEYDEVSKSLSSLEPPE